MNWNWTEYGLSVHQNDSTIDFFYEDDELYGNFSDFEGLRDAAYETENSTFRDLIAMLVITISISGLIINFFILSLSVCNIRGDYRLFIGNLAAVDIVCALLYAFMGYINLTDNNGNHVSSVIRAYSAFAFYGSFGILIFALVPVSLSRVVAASQPKVYDQLFSGFRALVICFVSDVIPVFLLFVICISKHHIAKWILFGYAAVTFLAHVVTFVSNTMVFRMVAKHISVVECLHDRTRLLETKQVAFATCAQAILPLICQIPAFLTLSSALLLVRPLTNATLIFITQLWLAANPLFDGLITLFVIKQYRIQTIGLFSMIFRTDRCGRTTKKLTNPNLIQEQQYSSSLIPMKIRVKNVNEIV